MWCVLVVVGFVVVASSLCAIGFLRPKIRPKERSDADGGERRRRREEHRWESVATMKEKCGKILDRVRSGELDVESTTTLDVSDCGLETFPEEILRLKNLEFLNLGKNDLTDLPASFASELPKLKILFCLGNKFTKVPEVLGEMKNLFMLSFKANKVREVPEKSLSPSLGWLILSDNEIEVLPESLGDCLPMRKLMLAGNKI